MASPTMEAMRHNNRGGICALRARLEEARLLLAAQAKTFGSKELRNMGYAITWCAVREEAADQLLSHLGLSATGETEEGPGSRFSTAKLTTGWRLEQ